MFYDDSDGKHERGGGKIQCYNTRVVKKKNLNGERNLTL